MLTVPLTDDDYGAATALMSGRPVYKGSHRGTAANEVGCLGEAVAMRVLADHGIPLVPVFGTTHDLELAVGGTVEVKTKDRTVAPLPEYDCSIPDYVADHQSADFYLFVSLQRERHRTEGLERFHTAHVVGVASPSMLARKGRLMSAGTTDTNGTTFWTACRNISIGELVPFPDAVRLWRASDERKPL